MKVSQASRLAVENVAREGLTDIFLPPKELTLLKNEAFRKKLVKQVTKCINGDSLDSLEIGPIDHVLLPKGGPFDFRRCALIHPLDTIKYLALSLTIADELEKFRLSNHRRMVYSYRYRPNKGYLFNPKYNITAFQHRVRTRSRLASTNVLVSCDIASFYDRLNLHRLESILLSFPIEKTRVSQINQLLLFWANRDSYGLPVGSNASRILAEGALIEVDNYLLSIGVKFCRFVDDYRLFAPNAHTAHYWLTQLIERLWIEGLTINKSKTKIEDVSNLLPVEVAATPPVPPPSKQTGRSPRAGMVPEPQFRIVAGYGGIIPTRFRKPTSDELSRLRDVNARSTLIKLKAKQILPADDVLHYAKVVVSQGKFRAFSHFPDLAQRYPQITPYLVDILIKFGGETPGWIRSKIRDSFAHRLKTTPLLPEYIAMTIVKLLGKNGYEDKNTLLAYFRALRRNAGAYIGRALLDSLETQLSRGEVLEIRQYFQRADQWEKRQIVRIVDFHLSNDEKRPWMKNVRSQESRDMFLAEYIKPTK